MAVLTKDQLKTLNHQMLGLGAPVELDMRGYNMSDYGLMYNMSFTDAAQLTDKQILCIVKTLSRYKNTQLTEYKADIEETLKLYTKRVNEPEVCVLNKTPNYIQITFSYNANVSNALKTQLDKSQYRWVKDDGWKLNVNWDYIPTLTKVFQDNGFNCEQLLQARKPAVQLAPTVPQPTLMMTVKRSDDPDSLEIRFSYSQAVIDILRNIPYAYWDKTKKCWKVYIEYAAQLYTQLPAEVNKSQLAYWNNLVTSWKTAYKLVDYTKYDLKFTPYEFQPTDAHKLLKLKTGLNANEVGCGKTFEMVLIGESIPMPKLVICPATLRLNWEKEIKMVNPDATVHIQYSDQPFVTVAGWNIIGYSSLTKFQTELEKANFQVLMADEAHYIQAINNYGQPNSQRAKSVLRLAATAAYVFPITGTPKTSRNKNLYNILRMIRHPLTRGFAAFHQYGNEYCNGQRTAFGYDYDGNSNDYQLNNLITPYMVRHLKREVLPHIQKQRQSIPVSVNLRKYQQLMDALRKRKSINEELAYLAKAKQLIATQKAKHSIEFAKTFVDAGEKVVIVTCYTDVVTQVEAAFDCVKIVGGMSDKAKQAAINDFQHGDTQVIVINVVAGGVGITLTASHTMIINDMPWVPGDVEQAEGRIWRAGQTETAMIYYMTAYGCPMDEMLVGIIVSKSQTINAAIDGGTGDEFDFHNYLLSHTDKL